MRYRTEDAAFHLDRLQCKVPQLWGCCRCRVFEDQTIEPAIVRFPHGRGDADVGGDSHQDKVPDAAQTKEMLELGVSKSSSPGFVDDQLARERLELWYHIMSQLSTDEESPQRPCVTNTEMARIIP